MRGEEALALLDIVAIVSAGLGFLTVAVLTRIANVVPGRAKRARRPVFGDADCLTLPALTRLFPVDGVGQPDSLSSLEMYSRRFVRKTSRFNSIYFNHFICKIGSLLLLPRG